MMRAAGRYAGQLFAYALFAGVIGVFATEPRYFPLDPQDAMIKLSFTHVGRRAGACRTLSAEELARLPPNMRQVQDCPRGRVPLRVELELDGRLLLARDLPAAGLSHDRAASLYEKFAVPAGRHRVVVRLRDSARSEGYDYESAREVTLAPRQNFVIDFRQEAGGFIFH
jgi:hypothetical protein